MLQIILLREKHFFQNTVNNLDDCNNAKIVGGDYDCTLNPPIDRGECTVLPKKYAHILCCVLAERRSGLLWFAVYGSHVGLCSPFHYASDIC